MKSLLVMSILSLIIVAICICGLGIRILLKHRGEFKRHCSSMDPYTGKNGGCNCPIANKACDTRHKRSYQPLEINEELMNEIK